MEYDKATSKIVFTPLEVLELGLDRPTHPVQAVPFLIEDAYALLNRLTAETFPEGGIDPTVSVYEHRDRMRRRIGIASTILEGLIEVHNEELETELVQYLTNEANG